MTKYNCTVHTVEVFTTWIDKDAKNHDFVSEIHMQYSKTKQEDNTPKKNYDGWRVKINPHKLHRAHTGNAKWLFEYRTASEIDKDLQTCYALMGGVDCRLKRIDIALDTQRDYMDTEKIARLIALMLMDDAKNRYLSYDPLTLDVKSLVVANGKRTRDDTKQIEHYARNLMSQDDWGNEPVNNRFELRRMRKQIKDTDTVKSIGEKWLKDFDRMTEGRMQEVVQTISDGLYARWKRFIEMRSRITQRDRNMFYVCNSDYIFTREQLRKLYALDDVNATAVNNLLKADRYKTAFKLCEYKDVKQEIDAMRDALAKFIGE